MRVRTAATLRARLATIPLISINTYDAAPCYNYNGFTFAILLMVYICIVDAVGIEFLGFNVVRIFRQPYQWCNLSFMRYVIRLALICEKCLDCSHRHAL